MYIFYTFVQYLLNICIYILYFNMHNDYNDKKIITLVDVNIKKF